MAYLDNPLMRMNDTVESLLAQPTKDEQDNFVTLHALLRRQWGADQTNVEILERAARLVALPLAAQEFIEGVTDDTFYHAWIGPYTGALNLFTNLQTYSANFVSVLPADIRMNLQASMRFAGDIKAAGVEEAAISELIQEVERLAEELRGGSLVEPLKSFLIEQLERVRAALVDYRVRGGAGVTDACDAASGAVLRAWTQFPAEVWTSDNAKRSTRQFFDVLGKVGMLVDKAGALVAISEKLSNLVLAVSR